MSGKGRVAFLDAREWLVGPLEGPGGVGMSSRKFGRFWEAVLKVWQGSRGPP